MSPRNLSMSPVAVQILLSLAQAPLHGYGIKVDIEERTEGGISLGSGTLYQALQRLQGLGFIDEHGAPRTDDRRGRQYCLTESGRAALDAQLRVMQRTLASDYANVLFGTDRA